MPKLNTYTSQFQGLPISGGRRADAQDFGGDAAAATGELARTTAKVGDALLSHQEEVEQRRALVGSTEIRAKYARELDQAAQTGADTAAIKEKMEADLAKIGEDFQTAKGQASLDMHSANTSLMFDEQANRIEVQRAAATARIEGQKYMVESSRILMGNPYALKEREQGVDDLVATFSRISPEKRAEMALELKQNLNMTAALATVRIEPEIAKRKLQEGEWTLTGEQRQTALNAADSEISGRRSAENYAYQQEQRRIAERDEKAFNKHFTEIYEGRGSWPAIRDDADLQPKTREHLTIVMNRRAEELAGGVKHSNPSVLFDLTLRSMAPEGDPRRLVNADPVMKALERRELTVPHATTLFNRIQLLKDESGRAFTNRLHGRMSTISAAMRASPQYQAQPELSAAIQMEMVNQVEQKAAEMRRAGTDPSGLINPDSKDYYFTSDRMRNVAADVQRQTAPQMVDLRKEPDAWRGLKPGTVVIDPSGKPRALTQATIDALEKQGGAAPAAPAAPKAPAYESFIKAMPRSSSVRIDAPARSPARALQGQIFSTREQAIEALKRVYE